MGFTHVSVILSGLVSVYLALASGAQFVEHVATQTEETRR